MRYELAMNDFWEIDDYIDDIANESLSSIFSSAKVFIRKALLQAAELLEKFCDEVRRKADNLWNKISIVFDSMFKRFGNDGVTVPADTCDDITSVLDEFSDNMDNTTNIIIRHSDDYDRPFGEEADVGGFEDDDSDLNKCKNVFDALNNDKPRNGKKKKVPLGVKFFRDMKARFKQSYHKSIAAMKRLSTEQTKAANRGEYRANNSIVNRLCTAIMNVVYTIIAVLKASLDCATSILTMITQAVLSSKGVDTKDISDQGITIDPIIMGV